MKDKILIIGAGLCGSLLSIRLGQLGFNVELREKRSDLRKSEQVGGRSINLALSNRGLLALETAGMKTQILSECIPMHGRMIHGIDGSLRLSKYSGRQNEYINSVSRSGLNASLLEKADELSNVQMHFNTNCVGVDLKNGQAKFKNTSGEETSIQADIIIATDGAGSVVRRTMESQGLPSFESSTDYLENGYKELSIPPKEDGDFRIAKNALHIWPRGKFMMIALPNLDASFTVTLFHPYKGPQGFDSLENEQELLACFQKFYPDSIKHMPALLQDYTQNPVGKLGTVKCFPWSSYGKTLIMGDAAHAIVPFYGQGMNASFEDVRIFIELLEQIGPDWDKLFEKFQSARVEDTNAIADLAVDNFYEMQDKVDDLDFIKKRKLEMELEHTYPNYYSKYSLVTFKEELPYSEAMKIGRAQDELLLKLCAQEKDPKIEDALRQIEQLHQSFTNKN